MTKRTPLLLPTLLPLLFGVSAAACSENSTPGPGTDGSTGGIAPTGSGAAAGAATGGLPMGNGGTSGSPSVGGNGNTGGALASSGGNPGNSGGNGGIPNAGGAGGSEMVGGNTGAGGATPEPNVLTVQLGEIRQIIRGFGIGANILPSGTTLPWNQLFTLDGADALGLSILRIGMTETGTHRGVPDDWETARTLGARVIGTCWSAPADWKDNNRTTGGGHLRPDRYADWATMIAAYANDNALYAMSIGNQTDFATCSQSQGVACEPPLTDEFESMVYTGKEMANFVKVAGPIFKASAPNTKMIAPEATSWIHVWSNLSPTAVEQGYYRSSDPLDCQCFANAPDAAAEATCAPSCQSAGPGELGEQGYDYGHWLASDADSWSAFDILGVHEYESQVAVEWPADVKGGVRDKEVWQTEMSGQTHWPEQGPSKDIRNGVAVARWIHSALTVGEASAWLYFWYESPFRDDNEGLALTKNDPSSATPAKRYYTMGNFSRYIRPDVFHAVRVAGPAPEDVLVSAYKGDGGEVVIVAINETNQDIETPIAITGAAVPAMVVPHVTSASENWAEKTPIPVTDGSLQATLPAMSVTTFVSQ